jgi:hypothetical protein
MWRKPSQKYRDSASTCHSIDNSTSCVFRNCLSDRDCPTLSNEAQIEQGGGAANALHRLQDRETGLAGDIRPLCCTRICFPSSAKAPMSAHDHPVAWWLLVLLMPKFKTFQCRSI